MPIHIFHRPGAGSSSILPEPPERRGIAINRLCNLLGIVLASAVGDDLGQLLMPSQSPKPAGTGARRLLAPKWHTAGLIGILLLAVAFGAWFQRQAGPNSGRAPEHRSIIGIYLTALLLDWALFYYVWAFAC